MAEDNFKNTQMEINEEVMRCTTCTVDEDCGMFLTHSQSKEMILDGIPVIMEEMESNKGKRKIETCMGPYIECPKAKISKFREQ